MSERRGDVFFVVAFSFFAFSSFFSDLAHSLGWVHAGNIFADGNLWYGEIAGDRLFLSDPGFLRIRTGISAFIYGPFYLLLVYAFLRGVNWIRVPALMYVGSMVIGVVEYLFWEFSLELPPTHVAVFLAFNLPYLIVPILLGYRMRHDEPFGDTPLPLGR